MPTNPLDPTTTPEDPLDGADPKLSHCSRSAPEPRSPAKEVGRREPRRQGSHYWGRWTMGHRSFVLFGGNDPAAMLGV
jgi:hypothetical protein